jgi:hypothetical protein
MSSVLTIDEAARILENSHSELIDELLHERRVDLPRLERHAVEALERPKERFKSERRIARTVLDLDIPAREKWIDAALLILMQGPDSAKAKFTVAPYSRQSEMVAEVLSAGGLDDERGKWRWL